MKVLEHKTERARAAFMISWWRARYKQEYCK
jgi:hypothetical protein